MLVLSCFVISDLLGERWMDVQIYFPIQCHLVTKGITWRQQKWWWLQALNLFTLLITIVSLIGSIEFVVEDLKVLLLLTYRRPDFEVLT